jgi:hypothetical protein
MVSLLTILYKIFPYYVGYLIFVGTACLLIIRADKSLITSAAIFTPVSFYYLAQTGKDGIAILAIASIASLTRYNTNIFSWIILGGMVSLGIFIRPAILLLLPIVFMQFKLGTKWATLSTFAVGIVFYWTLDSYDILNHLEGLTDDEGAGHLAAIMRYYSFGYAWEPVVYKIILLSGSLIFQPAMGAVKYLSGSEPFVLLEGGCFFAFLIFLLKKKIFLKFLISSLPYVIIIGISSPFYHFRYLAVAYPVIYAFCISVEGFGWKHPEFMEHRRKLLAGRHDVV